MMRSTCALLTLRCPYLGTAAATWTVRMNSGTCARWLRDRVSATRIAAARFVKSDLLILTCAAGGRTTRLADVGIGTAQRVLLWGAIPSHRKIHALAHIERIRIRSYELSSISAEKRKHLFSYIVNEHNFRQIYDQIYADGAARYQHSRVFGIVTGEPTFQHDVPSVG